VLTGETFPSEKEPGRAEPDAPLSRRLNCLFLGTNVRSGTARALIARTGPSTAYGEIAGRLRVRAPETEFDRGIRQFGYLLTVAMSVLVVVVFAVNVLYARPVGEALLFSVALAVGLSPELLPAILSVNLAQSARQMADRGVLVRRLAALENLGSMDVLCTEKTGTLTGHLPHHLVHRVAAHRAGGGPGGPHPAPVHPQPAQSFPALVDGGRRGRHGVAAAGAGRRAAGVRPPGPGDLRQRPPYAGGVRRGHRGDEEGLLPPAGGVDVAGRRTRGAGPARLLPPGASDEWRPGCKAS
jgi:hypothetical protein